MIETQCRDVIQNYTAALNLIECAACFDADSAKNLDGRARITSAEFGFVAVG